MLLFVAKWFWLVTEFKPSSDTIAEFVMSRLLVVLSCDYKMSSLFLIVLTVAEF